MKIVDRTKCRTCQKKLTSTNSYAWALVHGDYYCKKCLTAARRPSRIKENRKRKQLVIDAYGEKCICCGEKQFEFLSIDHVNGGGKIHRKKIGGSGNRIYQWLKQHDFPKKGYQLLCMNCNTAKGHYGYCPHEGSK